MANQVSRRAMEKWLLTHGFEEAAGKKTSHRQFKGHQITVTLPGHGASDLTKKHVGIILRQLENAGFEKQKVQAELGGT